MPVAPLAKKIWESAGQNHRLFNRAIIIGAKINRVFIQIFKQQARDLGHARFGVAIGGGTIAVDIAKIALAINQGIARGKILGQAHEGVVNRLVAMGMVAAHHVAHDLGGFLEGSTGVQTQEPHDVEKTAMNWLQAVTHIRQGPVHDGG